MPINPAQARPGTTRHRSPSPQHRHNRRTRPWPRPRPGRETAVIGRPASWSGPLRRSSVGSGPVPARTGCPAPGTTTDGSHVHFMIDRPGRHPARPRPHRHTYAADIRRGLPAVQQTRHRSRLPRKTEAAHCIPGHIRQIRVGTTLTGRQPLVRSRCTSGPASRTRTIWRFWRVPASSELLPTPHRRSPDQAAPSFNPAAATARRRRSSTSPRTSSASWRTWS